MSNKQLSVIDRYQNSDIAESYDSQRFRSIFARYAHRLEICAIDRLLEKAGKSEPMNFILDLPCGTGRITELLIKKGYNVTGVDIAEEMILEARKRIEYINEKGNFIFEVGDVRGTKYANEHFDCITSIRFLHHFIQEDKLKVLKELARITKRYLIVNFAYTSNWYAIRNGIKNLIKNIKGQPIQKIFSTEKEIQMLFQEARLREKGRIFVFPYLSENVIFLLEKIVL